MLNTRLPSILVPKTESALTKICGGYRGDDESFYTFSFDRQDLEEILCSDFFEKINSEFNLEIDEYEEVIIFDKTILPSMIEYLTNINSEKEYGVLVDFYIPSIIVCLKKSIEYNYGIAFFL